MWRLALLMYSTAFEAILTYKRGRGITERLSKSLACFLAIDQSKQRILYYKFKDLYNIRSDIIHGKYLKRSNSKSNLKKLEEITDLLRQVWQKIIQDKAIISILESDDNIREVFFYELEKNFKKQK